MCQRRAELFPGCCLPEPGGIVRASGEDGLAIAAECHRKDHVRMLHRLDDPLVAGAVPEPDYGFRVSGQNGLPIRTVRHGMDPIALRKQFVVPSRAGCRVPEPRSPTSASKCGLAIGAIGYGIDRAMLQRQPEGFAGRHVPEPGRGSFPGPRVRFLFRSNGVLMIGTEGTRDYPEFVPQRLADELPAHCVPKPDRIGPRLES